MLIPWRLTWSYVCVDLHSFCGSISPASCIVWEEWKRKLFHVRGVGGGEGRTCSNTMVHFIYWFISCCYEVALRCYSHITEAWICSLQLSKLLEFTYYIIYMTQYWLTNWLSFSLLNQIYSRTPDPGPKFIEKYKNYLGSLGYDPSKIKDTPQDCEVKSTSQLAAMMSMSGMQQALNNQFPDLELRRPVQFNPFTSILDTLKKLVELYFKQWSRLSFMT